MILVTGGSGFIGTYLCRRLLNEGNKVLCIDINQSIIKHDNFIFIQSDIIELGLLKGIEKIYHLACHACPERYQKDPIHTIRTCVEGTRNVLEIAKENNCPILFTSTSEVYGEALEHPQKESYKGNVSCTGPRACYDEGKRIAETLMFEYKRRYNVDIHVCRLFNTYGPEMNDARAIPTLIRSYVNNTIFTIYGDGNQTRSFCYIDDTVEAIIRFINSDFPGPINIGNPEEISINDLVREFGRVTNSEIACRYQKARENDPVKRRPDITLAKQILNWEPKITLQEGLKKLL